MGKVQISYRDFELMLLDRVRNIDGSNIRAQAEFIAGLFQMAA